MLILSLDATPTALKWYGPYCESGTDPLSPAYGECSSRLAEGVCSRGNPPREPGCGALNEAVGSSPWLRTNESRVAAHRSHFHHTRRGIVRMRKSFLFIHPLPLLKLFDAWEEAAAASGNAADEPRPLHRRRRPSRCGKMPPVQRTMSDLRTRSEGM